MVGIFIGLEYMNDFGFFLYGGDDIRVYDFVE